MPDPLDWQPTIDLDVDRGTVTLTLRHVGPWASELEALIEAEWAVRNLLDIVQRKLHEARAGHGGDSYDERQLKVN